jgi:CRP-like cAMP-binding protein
VLSKLPPQLQLETSKAIRLELLLKTKLVDLLPRAVLGYITKEMSDLVITPGELLMIEGDTGTYDMYVVVEGIFEITGPGA